MSDILNIRVTQRELDLILDLLHEAGTRTDADGQPAIELCHAETAFVDAGIQAREMQKASSRAADRRTEALMRGTASPVANDPVDW